MPLSHYTVKVTNIKLSKSQTLNCQSHKHYYITAECYATQAVKQAPRAQYQRLSDL